LKFLSSVVSCKPRQEDHPKVTIVSDRVEDLLNELRTQPGKDIWLFGVVSCSAARSRSLRWTVEPAVIPVLLEYDVEGAAGKRSAGAKGGEGVAAR
jgi:hypothetical protein